MANINIRRDVKDSFYRYKMPKLQAKIEGKGNGIKTVIPNMSDIARALSRPPAYPTKFFGCELGAQVKCEDKSDRYIVNGAHDADRLQCLLDVFIDKFVLCQSCKNPETDLIINRDQDIIRDCKACGQRTGVEMRHKLTTFILKNPPESGKKGKKSRGQHASAGNDPTDAVGSVGGDPSLDEAGSDDELTRRIVAEAADLPSASHQDDDDDDWAVDDMSDAAIKARQEALASRLQNKLMLEDGDDLEDGDAGGPSKYDEFGEFLTQNPKASGAEIRAKAEELQVWGKHRAIEVLVQALFTTNVVAELKAHQKTLMAFGRTDKHQRSIIGGLERLIGVKHPAELLPKTPQIFMTLYDLDLVDEETFSKWSAKVSKKYVDRDTGKKIHAKAEPFIQWLNEADEETESESE
ncbi:eukaryotic translation initiation factor 5 [Dimargaris cristalligena]|uniref:Domain found in IF2B/IF5-domain-containing protein n=1 Tax=Dimargaris cristalligena TaxID=215637 RepID=A0A4P9ZS51_9FUNG|nr:eukaryotic translation initiation factor 5 [Dimargaris cristalligena]RKP36247.1 domain found in IF2B/IF5-domain-containing protein [Dimargaris cristalligena]|eukprot:RKP36247.1 domain found in IF2B/IF5-domain-containing protein [Dimargaris cristalligena]